MGRNLKQALLKAANCDPYNLTSAEILDLFEMIDRMSDEDINYLARLDAPQPGVYIEFWRDLHHEEHEDG